MEIIFFCIVSVINCNFEEAIVIKFFMKYFMGKNYL